jgi:UMF1 family MFS transporter
MGGQDAADVTGPGPLSGPAPSSEQDRAAADVARFPLGRLAALTPTGRARVPIAWALYDFGNTIFSAAIVSTAISLWLTAPERLGQDTGQLVLSLAVAISVGINAVVSPILGALSDRGGRRLPFLLFFTLLAIVPTAMIGPTPALVGAALFAVANFAYEAALIYYNAMLATVSVPATRGTLSGIGVAVGYLGTIFVSLVLIGLGITEQPEPIFGIAAVLFAAFALPIFIVVREPVHVGVKTLSWSDVTASIGQVIVTLRNAGAVPGLGRFLLARFFYSDAVATLIVVMSVVAVRAMGFSQGEFLAILLMLAIIAIIASLGWGWMVDRFGPKRTLVVVLASWVVGLVGGVVALGAPGTAFGNGLFIVAGAILGSGLGGVQVADRVFMVQLSPPRQLGEFFGLYGLVGKGSQVVGQVIFGVIVFLFFDALGNGAYQLAILSLLVTMAIGLWLIWPVSDRWRDWAIEELVSTEPAT